MLKIETHEYPNIGVVYLKGKLTMEDGVNFDKCVRPLRENYEDIGISFEDVTFVDSSGLGLLVQLYKHLSKKAGNLYIFGANGEIEDIFKMARLNKYFKVLSKDKFKKDFIGLEYKMDFKVHKPAIDMLDMNVFTKGKLAVADFKKIFNENNEIDFYFEEDTNIYKRGKEITEQDIEQLESRGYEHIWVSTVKPFTPEDTHEEMVREIRTELEKSLTDLFTVFDESDVKKGSRGVLSYFDGEDLIKSQLNPLQREGTQKLYEKLFSDTGKLQQLKTLLEKLIQNRVTNVDVFSARSTGMAEQSDMGHPMNRKMDEISYRLINHSVASAIMFVFACNRIFGKRASEGYQVSVQRLEKGEKTYDKAKRSQFQTDLILNAAFGTLLHDFGFNHRKLRSLLEKELKQTKTEDGTRCKDSSIRLADEERAVLKRHVNVAYNILSSNHEAMYASAIADNIVKFHHCFLDGNGYPDRKQYTEDRKVYFRVPLHELTRLFTIINYYDSFLDRKPYRLPLRRETLIKYIFSHSVFMNSPTGNPDDNGLWDIDTQIKQPGLFDGLLVKEFFRSINPYKVGETVFLRNDKNNKCIQAIINKNNPDMPDRPLLKIYTGGKWGDIDLSSKNYVDWYVDDLFETVTL